MTAYRVQLALPSTQIVKSTSDDAGAVTREYTPFISLDEYNAKKGAKLDVLVKVLSHYLSHDDISSPYVKLERVRQSSQDDSHSTLSTDDNRFFVDNENEEGDQNLDDPHAIPGEIVYPPSPAVPDGQTAPQTRKIAVYFSFAMMSQRIASVSYLLFCRSYKF